MIAAWIATEMETLDLGDVRRERRAGIILDNLSQMSESQPEAAKSKAGLKAMYRFANNEEITPDAILSAHNQASIQRTTLYERVILAQDTTDVDLTNPNCQVEGAGPLESEDKRGFFLHPLYAITEDGVPLGIVDQEIWTREQLRTDLSKEAKERLRKQLAFEEKESQRWLAMFQSGEQIARANPGTEYTVVGDSESDIHEIFVEAGDLPSNCHFVIRGCQDRAVVNDGDALCVDAVLAKAKVQFTCEVEISERVSKIVGETRVRRKSRTPRLARLSIRAARITIRGPARPGGKLPAATLNVVEVVELDPPEGEDPIRWVLFTTLPVNTITEILRVI